MAEFDDLPIEVQTMILKAALPDEIQLKLRHDIETHVYARKREDHYKSKPKTAFREVQALRQTPIVHGKKEMVSLGSKGRLNHIHTLVWTPHWVPRLAQINRSTAQQAQSLIVKAVAVVIDESLVWEHSPRMGGTRLGRLRRTDVFARKIPPVKLQLLPRWIRSNIKTLYMEDLAERSNLHPELLPFAFVDVSEFSRLTEIMLSPQIMQRMCMDEIRARLRPHPGTPRAYSVHANVFKTSDDNFGCAVPTTDWIKQDQGLVKALVARHVVDKVRGEGAAAAEVVERIYRDSNALA
ncbi:uncharacterized protein AB675_8584 [Cyphellophora attinorum]|uniref:Uncharacterized protein n=1 Tax=Cyphellophora attinorum TaxID=1664694 RepID=A0A0N0NR36_9EURO|nr:uncharacterized protein AB675_8584 [Phialophora attinorum]KPI44641.1 hypothetical protein AB675_8584 [Phialophora attinorum]